MELVSYLGFPMGVFPSFPQSGALNIAQMREQGLEGGEAEVCGEEGAITVPLWGNGTFRSA